VGRLVRSVLRLLSTAGVWLALSAGAPPAASGAVRVYSPSAYEGLAAWVDIYDRGPWERPERTVRGLAHRGVATLFLQTSNYRRRSLLHRPAVLSRLLAAADRAGIRTIAWYLPGFDAPLRDWRRVKAAVTHVSAAGDRFDGFAMDIEATAVRDIGLRNRRALSLSSRLRRLVGDRATIGAIIPDPVAQRYWPRFPYRKLRAHFDVFLPMAYWTHHSRGAARVRRYTRLTLRLIRARTGDREVPIHPIGGIASHASVAEVRGFAGAVRDFAAAGASLYDAPITSAAQWQQLRRIAVLGERQPRRRARAGSARSIHAMRALSQRRR
jgi:hypothetical protein